MAFYKKTVMETNMFKCQLIDVTYCFVIYTASVVMETLNKFRLCEGLTITVH